MRGIRSFVVLPCLLSMLASQSAGPKPAAGRPELTGLLDFEGDHVGGVPKGWGGFPPGTLQWTEQIVHGGRWALRIDRSKRHDCGTVHAATKCSRWHCGTSSGSTYLPQ